MVGSALLRLVQLGDVAGKLWRRDLLVLSLFDLSGSGVRLFGHLCWGRARRVHVPAPVRAGQEASGGGGRRRAPTRPRRTRARARCCSARLRREAHITEAERDSAVDSLEHMTQKYNDLKGVRNIKRVTFVGGA